MNSALILGSNGQDGSYLAEILLERGYQVTGVARQDESRWVHHPMFRHVMLDLRDHVRLDALLAETMPAEIYALAVVHGSSGFDYESVWPDALMTNTGSVQICLDHLRRRAPKGRLFVASSSKAFGPSPTGSIDETTPRTSSCLYSITKNAAADLVNYYRLRHGVWAAVGYLFNHDSPRRPAGYFLPSIVGQLAAHLHGWPSPAPINSVSFWCDWGSSREFMEAAADLMRANSPEDVIIASGAPLYAADLAADLAEAAGRPAENWLIVREPPGTRPQLPARASLARLRRLIGRVPASDGLDVALWILRERHGIDLTRPGTARRAS